jgi:hypothetical protein
LSLELTLLPDPLAICRLPAATALPAWARAGGLTSVTWTSAETSLVCVAALVPPDVQADAGWRAFVVAGPLDFSLTGVLLSIAQPLADAGVSIFALSTYDTDYVLVKESALPAAVAALTGCGHRVID